MPRTKKQSSEAAVRDIRRKTRRRFSAEEKIRIQELATQLFEKFGSTPDYDLAVELERQMTDLVGGKGIYPNVDFYSGIVYQKLGIPSDLFTPIFAISRVSGWLAHLLEQLEGNRIFRPSQIWVGEADRTYVPIEERA